MKVTIENDGELPALYYISESFGVPGNPVVVMPGAQVVVTEKEAICVATGAPPVVVHDSHAIGAAVELPQAAVMPGAAR